MSVVVIAENDPDALELALTDLRLEGHEVHGARDAAEAEELITELGPDTVVLDHRMPPGETGLSLAERLVVEHPRSGWSSTATTGARSSRPAPPRSGCRSWPRATCEP